MFRVLQTGMLLVVLVNPAGASDLAGTVAAALGSALPAQSQAAGSAVARPRSVLPASASAGFRHLEDVVSSAFGLMLGTADALLRDTGVRR